MAYARFGRDSDVYVYADTDGFVCERCPKAGLTFRCASAGQMIDHLRAHESRGDKVPSEAITELGSAKDEDTNSALTGVVSCPHCEQPFAPHEGLVVCPGCRNELRVHKVGSRTQDPAVATLLSRVKLVERITSPPRAPWWKFWARKHT